MRPDRHVPSGRGRADPAASRVTTSRYVPGVPTRRPPSCRPRSRAMRAARRRRGRSRRVRTSVVAVVDGDATRPRGADQLDRRAWRSAGRADRTSATGPGTATGSSGRRGPVRRGRSGCRPGRTRRPGACTGRRGRTRRRARPVQAVVQSPAVRSASARTDRRRRRVEQADRCRSAARSAVQRSGSVVGPAVAVGREEAGATAAA